MSTAAKKGKGKGKKAPKGKKDPKSPKKDPKSPKNGKGKKAGKKDGKSTKPKKQEESKEEEKVVVDFGPPVILPETKEFVTEIPEMTETALEDDDNVQELEKQFDDFLKLLKDRKKACVQQSKVCVGKDDEETPPICIDIDAMKHLINNIGTQRGEADYAAMVARQQLLDRGREILAYEAKHAVVTKERKATSKKAIQEEIDECKNKLSEAEPVLQAAKDALKSITKSSLDEIRALPKPHALLIKTVKACAVMAGRDESELDGWPSIKKLLKTAFIDSLLNFDPTCITEEIRDKLQGPDYLATNDDSIPEAERLTYENVLKANKVAGSLVKWIEAQLKYSEFLPLVVPIQAKLANLKIKLGNVEGVQKKLDDALAELDSRATKARQQFRDEGKTFGQKADAAKKCKS